MGLPPKFMLMSNSWGARRHPQDRAGNVERTNCVVTSFVLDSVNLTGEEKETGDLVQPIKEDD